MGPDLVFLDTETTGLNPPTDAIVEIALVSGSGEVLLDTLVNPGRAIGYHATKIHHITDQMVRHAPRLEQLWPKIEKMVTGRHIVIYNTQFDTRFFPGSLGCAAKVSCAMRRFAAIYRERDPSSGRGAKKLEFATRYIGYAWEGAAHRALADTKATRALWSWMENGAPMAPARTTAATPKSATMRKQQPTRSRKG